MSSHTNSDAQDNTHNRTKFADATTPGGFPMAITAFNGQYESGEQPRYSFELDILYFHQEIRNKPQWWIKVHNPDIINAWKGELVAFFEDLPHHGSTAAASSFAGPSVYARDANVRDDVPPRERAERQFDYALAECQSLARQYGDTADTCIPAAVDGVFARWGDYESSNLTERLLRDINLLRSRPAIGATEIDRHPGTPAMVDLVHPSLYAFESDQTWVVPHAGADVLESPPFDDFLGQSGELEQHAVDDSAAENEGGGAVTRRRRSPLYNFISKTGLQWLPSEVVVEEMNDGERTCRINSYINNLHPKKHPELYKSLGELFLSAVPLLEQVLAEVKGNPVRERKLRIPLLRTDHYEEFNPPENSEDEDDYYDDYYENRNFIPPTIPTFQEPIEYTCERTQVSLVNRPLQVIFKIATLELEPGETNDSGVWHVEGMLDERIVATACCYVDSHNIQGGELQFRTSVGEPGYEQGDDRGIRLLFGLHNEELLVQPRGQCKTAAAENGGGSPRILAWPNTLQHRVNKVTLVDPEQPGRRTICCFFLVDPTVRIRSTATVPPQQCAWVAEVVCETMFQSSEQLVEPALRQKILENLRDETSLLSYEMACERRERLMEERGKAMGDEGDYEHFFARAFSLCEH